MLFKLLLKKLSIEKNDIVVRVLFIIIFSIILFNVNNKPRSTDVFRTDTWKNNITEIKFENPSITILSDFDQVINLSEFGINVTTIYLIKLNPDQIYLNSSSYTNETKLPVINYIIFPIRINQGFADRFPYYNDIKDNNVLLPEEFGTYDKIHLNSSSWINVRNNMVNNNIMEKLINNIEFDTSNFFSFNYPTNKTMVILNRTFFNKIFSQILNESIVTFERYDLWDLPGVYPEQLDELYNFTLNIQNVAKNQILTKFYLGVNCNIIIYENLLLKIEESQFNAVEDTMTIFLIMIPFIILNILIGKVKSKTDNNLFQNFYRKSLLRGISTKQLFLLSLRFQLFNELLVNFISIIIIVVFSYSNFIGNLLYLILGMILISVFQISLGISYDIKYFNSINTVEKTVEIEKNDNELIYFIVTVIVIIFITILIYIIFKDNLNGINFLDLIIPIVFVLLLYVSIKSLRILIDKSQYLLEKISIIKIQKNVLSKFNFSISRVNRIQMLLLTFVIMIIIIPQFSLFYNIDRYSRYHNKFYTISDKYFENVNDGDLHTLNNSPYVINKLIIENIPYNGLVSYKSINFNIFVNIYLINFSNLEQILDNDLFKTLDEEAQLAIHEGLDFQNSVLISKNLFQEINLKIDANLKFDELNEEFHIYDSLTFFPGVYDKNWIVLNSNVYNASVFEGQYSQKDWIGKISDEILFNKWVIDNIGYVKERTDTYNELKNINPVFYYKLRVIRLISNNIMLLMILLILTFFSVLTKLIILVYKLNKNYDIYSNILIIRGADLHHLDTFIHKDFIQGLTFYFIILLPIIMINAIFQWLLYFRIFQDLPNINYISNITHVIIAFPILCVLIYLILFVKNYNQRNMRIEIIGGR